MATKIPQPDEANINIGDNKAPLIPTAELMGDPLDGRDDIEIRLRINSQQPRWEDSYKLQSYYINKELLTLLNKKALRMGKGAKTLIINEALKAYLLPKK